MRALKIEIIEGAPLPRGYGIGYFEPDRYVAWAYPIPLNKIVLWWRRFWYWLRVGDVSNAYTQAYSLGKARGYEAGENEYREFLLNYLKDVQGKISDIHRLIEHKEEGDDRKELK